ncbi:MAG: ABC transporter ATP-binding protein [Marinifilaceae bacterium]|nr:ABC transporter ATP-binding protein [Marinifilaceae bacterium]
MKSSKLEKSTLIELTDICAGYKENIVLENVNLSIKENDFLGIIGPNGGGKTTLLKIILGIIKPFSGQINYSNKSKIIGYLPQVNMIDKNFPINVNQVVLSGLMSKKKLWSRYSKDDKEKALELLADMGIYELKDKPIGQLSGGQLQRVYLCRSLISKPKLLILDEPETYVDSNFENELYDKLDALNKEMAIVVVSHDIGTICSHVKTVACVNKALCYHNSNEITEQMLKVYNCPLEIITHGKIPHRVLKNH